MSESIIIYFTDGKNPPRVLNISEYVRVVVGTPEAPEGIGVYVTGDFISIGWEAALYASYYDVYINGEKHNELLVGDTFYQLEDFPEGTHEVQIRSRGSGFSDAEDLTSELSAPVEFQVKSVPENLQIAGTILSWDELEFSAIEPVVIEAAEAYNVYANGVKLNSSPIEGTSYDFIDLLKGTYSFTVRALFTVNDELREFADSDPLVLEVLGAPAPANFVMETSTPYGYFLLGTLTNFDPSKALILADWSNRDAVDDIPIIWSKPAPADTSYRAEFWNGYILTGIGAGASTTGIGVVEMFDIEGDSLWSKSGYGDIIAVAFDVDGDAYILCNEAPKTIVKFNKDTGAELASFEVTDMTVADIRGFEVDRFKNIYVYGGLNPILKYDSDFNKLWESPTPYNTINIHGHVRTGLNGELFTVEDSVDQRDIIRRLNPSDGTEIWGYDPNASSNFRRGRGIGLGIDEFLIWGQWDIPRRRPNYDFPQNPDFGFERAGAIYGIAIDNENRNAMFVTGSRQLLNYPLDGSWVGVEGSYTTNLTENSPRTLSAYPGPISAVDPGTGEVYFLNFSWDDVPQTEGYNLYVSLNGGAYEKVNSELLTETSFFMDAVSPARYNAYVVAVRHGEEGVETEVVTLGINVPEAPENVVADQGDGEYSIDVAWDEETGADWYNVYLSSDGGSTYARMNSEPVTDTSFNIPVAEVGDYKVYVTSVWMEAEGDPGTIVDVSVTLPPLFETDFSEFTVNDNVNSYSAFSSFWGATTFWGTIVNSYGTITPVIGDKIVRLFSASNFERGIKIEPTGIMADTEVLMLTECNGQCIFAGDGGHKAVVRGYLDGGQRNGYVFEWIEGGNNRYVLSSIVNGSRTILADNMGNPTVDVWMWVRLNVTGNRVRGKMWRYGAAEPDWQADVINNDHSEGYAGWSQWRGSGGSSVGKGIDYFAVSAGTRIGLPS